MEKIAMKQHFSFEMYAPNSWSESGIPVVERVGVQMQGEDLPIEDVIGKFEDFLKSCGYSTLLEGRRIDIVVRNG